MALRPPRPAGDNGHDTKRAASPSSSELETLSKTPNKALETSPKRPIPPYQRGTSRAFACRFSTPEKSTTKTSRQHPQPLPNTQPHTPPRQSTAACGGGLPGATDRARQEPARRHPCARG